MSTNTRENYPATQGPRLDGQVALVTGGSSGIGKGVALALAQAGADVVVNFHGGKEAADEVVAAIREAGRRAIAVKADVSDEASVRRMFESLLNEFDRLDILVNNAGIQMDAKIEEMTLEQWQTVIGVNLTGQFLCAREAVRHFKERGVQAPVSCAAGKIICMSSVHEIIPWAGHGNYAASKGGVMLFAKSLAQEVAGDAIRVNSIAPGAVRTPINRAAWETEEAYKALMELVPYNRIGEPADIGNAAVWLASDHSDYVTGTTLVVDGGMTLYPGFATGG
jgi:glucose 1-dehydrogenase